MAYRITCISPWILLQEILWVRIRKLSLLKVAQNFNLMDRHKMGCVLMVRLFSCVDGHNSVVCKLRVLRSIHNGGSLPMPPISYRHVYFCGIHMELDRKKILTYSIRYRITELVSGKRQIVFTTISKKENQDVNISVNNGSMWWVIRKLGHIINMLVLWCALKVYARKEREAKKV